MNLSPSMRNALDYIRHHQPPVAYVSLGTARALEARGLIECFVFHGVRCWRVKP